MLKRKNLHIILHVILSINFVYSLECYRCQCDSKDLQKNCICRSRISTNCSTDNTLFDLPSDIGRLNLYGFNLEIWSFKQKMEKLDYLTIDSCQIRYIDPKIFDNTPQLKFLYLENSVINITAHTFDHTPNLLFLTLRNNSMQKLDDIFIRKLHNLFSIDLEDNKLTKIPNFGELGGIHKISLNKNKIKSVENELQGCTSLKILELNQNKIQNVAGNSFTNLKLIWEIHLDDNEIEDIPNFRHLNFLEVITLRNNNIKVIGKNIFEGCKNLKYIVLNKNKIHNIARNIFIGLKSITTINLGDNEIQDIPNFRNLNNLEWLSLQNNKIELIADNIFDGCVNLKYIVLNESRIHTVAKNAFTDFRSIIVIDLDDNEIEEIPSVRHLGNLEELNLRNNKIRVVEENTFEGCGSLIDIFLSKNRIHNIARNVFTNLTSLLGITLDNNEIEEIPRLKYLSLLEVIELQNNKIKVIEENVFEGCDKLNYIDLTENKIHTIPTNTFTDLKSILYIYLGNNEIGDIPSFRHLVHLKELNLQNNKIKVIAENIFEGCERLQLIGLNGNEIVTVDPNIFDLPKIKYLSMTESSINCDCNIRDIHTKYMQPNISGTIRCSNGKTFLDLSEKDLVCFLPEILQCTNEHLADITKITCSIIGNPLPQIFWKLNDTELTNNTIHDINSCIRNNKIISYLTIMNGISNQNESYTLEARNDVGKILYNITLKAQRMTDIEEDFVDTFKGYSASVAYIVIGVTCAGVFLLCCCIAICLGRTKKENPLKFLTTNRSSSTSNHQQYQEEMRTFL